MTLERVAASYRDPSGFVYRRDGILLRQVQATYRVHYEALLESGLYDELVEAGLLLSHEEAPLEHAAAEGAFRVLRPRAVPFVSYPFEWCFDQLRDAALATLEVQRRALARGLVLKDASAFNIQFVDGRATLIDTLSFETYEAGRPWIAYRQFCQHFLAPLLLAATVDERLLRLSRQHLDGVPLELASRLLPKRSWLRPGVLLHVHLHARSMRRYQATGPGRVLEGRGMSRTALLGLVDSLASNVRRLAWRGDGTEWAAYPEEHRYSERGLDRKLELVRGWLEQSAPREVWDLGANVGSFARLAAATGARVIAMDADPGAVARAYRAFREDGETNILPLVIDLTNPTPGLGWGYLDCAPLVERGQPDVVLGLALVHHLALTYNLPLPRIVDWIAGLAPRAVLEFVPKDDPQAQRLLASREDVFAGYDVAHFEAALRERFVIEAAEPLPDSGRRLYRLRGRGASDVDAPARSAPGAESLP